MILPASSAARRNTSSIVVTERPKLRTPGSGRDSRAAKRVGNSARRVRARVCLCVFVCVCVGGGGKRRGIEEEEREERVEREATHLARRRAVA